MASESLQSNSLGEKFSFIDWFLPIFLILGQYSIGSFSNYGVIILIIYTLLSILKTNNTLYLNKHLFYFIIIVSIIQVFNLARLNAFSVAGINNFVMQLIIILILAATIPSVHAKNLYKSYTIIGSVAITIMYFQAFRLLLFNIPAIPVTFLPVSPEDAHFWGSFKGLRPSSLFTEPQAYASFMIPLLVLALKYKNLLFSYIISFSILLSTSSQGILLVAIIYLYTIFFSDTSWYVKILSILFAGLAIYAFFNLSIFDFALKKLGNTNIENNVRLTRGFLIYISFDFLNLLIGIGGGIKDYVLTHLSYFPWANIYIQSHQEFLLGYATTVALILLQFGLIGAFMFFRMLYKMFKYEDNKMRLFLLIIIILSFTQTILFNAWFIFYYIIYMGCCDKPVANLNRNYISLNFKTKKPKDIFENSHK